jgi:hypothetical protein
MALLFALCALAALVVALLARRKLA